MKECRCCHTPVDPAIISYYTTERNVVDAQNWADSQRAYVCPVCGATYRKHIVTFLYFIAIYWGVKFIIFSEPYGLLALVGIRGDAMGFGEIPLIFVIGTALIRLLNAKIVLLPGALKLEEPCPSEKESDRR